MFSFFKSASSDAKSISLSLDDNPAFKLIYKSSFASLYNINDAPTFKTTLKGKTTHTRVSTETVVICETNVTLLGFPIANVQKTQVKEHVHTNEKLFLNITPEMKDYQEQIAKLLPKNNKIIFSRSLNINKNVQSEEYDKCEFNVKAIISQTEDTFFIRWSFIKHHPVQTTL